MTQQKYKKRQIVTEKYLNMVNGMNLPLHFDSTLTYELGIHKELS